MSHRGKMAAMMFLIVTLGFTRARQKAPGMPSNHRSLFLLRPDILSDNGARPSAQFIP